MGMDSGIGSDIVVMPKGSRLVGYEFGISYAFFFVVCVYARVYRKFALTNGYLKWLVILHVYCLSRPASSKKAEGR